MTVRFSLRRFRQFAWVAMFALMVNVLAPGISHALVAAGALPADTVEICTPTGVKLLSVFDSSADPQNASQSVSQSASQDGPQDGGALAKSLAVCAYCMTHSASSGLEPVLYEPCSLQIGPVLPASSLSASPAPARVWVVHSPRAPPIHA